MPSAPLRILIAAGGTGGHVLPAIATIHELRQRHVPMEILWVGSKSGVEAKIANENDIPFTAIEAGKLRRYVSLENLRDALRIPVGVMQAWRIHRSFKPDIVFSTGGFVSVPTVLAARKNTPILTHEQTAQVGLANQIVARRATRFAVAFEETATIARTMHRDVVVTGNPVRASLTTGDRDKGLRKFGFNADLPVLYVTGGARGASPLNERIEALLPDILEHVQILHQAGPSAANADADRLARFRETWPQELQSRYHVTEFVGDELPDVFAMADLILSRSGAGTVAELTFVGKPAILIPLPGTGGDEQTRNARVLEAADAATVIVQAGSTPDTIRDTIVDQVHNPERLRTVAHNAKRIGRPDAASRLADELLDLAGRSAT